VVIPAAGRGTRLLPVTKELPKEMLPIFDRGPGGGLVMKPILQIVFEQAHDAGFREFCFIVGRGKRAIEDHLTMSENLSGSATELRTEQPSLSSRVNDSVIMWVNQPEPKGFGDAVLRSQPFVGNEPFLVLAGDTEIVWPSKGHLNVILNTYAGITPKPEALFYVKRVSDPRHYGVVELDDVSIPSKVKDVQEKPTAPRSDLAIMPVYIFQPTIFRALENVSKDTGETELTDGIQRLIDWGLDVRALKLPEEALHLDIGNPSTYWEALNVSHQLACGELSPGNSPKDKTD
jgi:UTP--glucose-1-phosphate uridylyltransferase